MRICLKSNYMDIMWCKGRAIWCQGVRAVRVIEGQRGKNVTLCLAVSPMIGLVHWMTFDGGMTRDIFGNFLMEISEMLQYNTELYVLLCDNVSSHLNHANFGDQGAR